MESIRDIFDENLKRLASLKYMLQYQEYLALRDEVCATLYFQDYYTLKYGNWPNDLHLSWDEKDMIILGTAAKLGEDIPCHRG